MQDERERIVAFNNRYLAVETDEGWLFYRFGTSTRAALIDMEVVGSFVVPKEVTVKVEVGEKVHAPNIDITVRGDTAYVSNMSFSRHADTIEFFSSFLPELLLSVASKEDVRDED